MRSLIFCCLLFAGSAFALVERTIDEKRPFEATLSTASHNRIAVEEGAVEKIFADSSLFSIAIDSTTGNAFLNVEKEIDEPVTITVVTSSGAVQDLLIRSSGGPSEQIRLHLPSDGNDWAYHSDPSMAGGVGVLNQIIEGSIPAGYGQREWEAADELALPAPLIAIPLKAVEGPFEILTAYEIRNPGKKLIALSPEEIKGGNAWVFLSVRVLEQNEKAICILGRAKDV